MDKEGCTGRFPIFAILIFILGILWLLSDLGVFILDIPWLALIVIILSLGMMVKQAHYKK